jgi:hypothetical protein
MASQNGSHADQSLTADVRSPLHTIESDTGCGAVCDIDSIPIPLSRTDDCQDAPTTSDQSAVRAARRGMEYQRVRHRRSIFETGDHVTGSDRVGITSRGQHDTDTRTGAEARGA